MSSTMIRQKRRARRRRARPRFFVLAALMLALIAVATFYLFRFPEEAKKDAYPIAYRDEIGRYAREYALDPARVAAVIFCESSFRADAISSAGAMGLMQIMPDTGGWIAKKLGDDAYRQADLLTPETNVRYGCWYLHYLNERFDGDITKVTAAYHAGGTTVDNWLKEPKYSTDGVSLADMPESATKEYVGRVLAAYDVYKEIL